MPPPSAGATTSQIVPILCAGLLPKPFDKCRGVSHFLVVADRLPKTISPEEAARLVNAPGVHSATALRNTVAPKASATPWFLPRLQGTRTAKTYLRRLCRRLSDELGIYVNDGGTRKPVQPRILRNCFASEAVQSGLELQQLQRLLGHRIPRSTEAYMQPKDSGGHCRTRSTPGCCRVSAWADLAEVARVVA